jgi:hypothetical protein
MQTSHGHHGKHKKFDFKQNHIHLLIDHLCLFFIQKLRALF